jgi:L-lactate oxidase
MNVSRRDFVTTSGLAAVAIASQPISANAQAQPAAPSLVASELGPNKVLQIVSLDDVENNARGVLSAGAMAFVANGAGDQWTLRENRRAFNDFPIATHRLRGVDAKTISLSVKLLGSNLPVPLIVAPMGAHGMVHPGAEAVTARGADMAGVLYSASGASNLPLEKIAEATKGPKWFQAYLNADAGVTHGILLRARDAKFSAIVLTADAPGPGASDEFVRLGRPFPPGMTFGNNDPRFGGRGNFLDQKVALTFDDIGTVRSLTGLPVIVKGIMRAEDARDAVAAGATAVQVSNHGGRQIDGVPGSISMLREVIDAVAKDVPVIFDGGIRRGIDVFRALAIGASAVAVGRPILFGAAVGGADGVKSVIDHLRQELQTAMLLAGAQSVDKIGRDYLKLQPT